MKISCLGEALSHGAMGTSLNYLRPNWQATPFPISEVLATVVLSKPENQAERTSSRREREKKTQVFE